MNRNDYDFWIGVSITLMVIDLSIIMAIWI